MKKVYYLGTCDTCKRILKELQLPSEFVKHEIKQKEIPVKELDALQKLTGSYEALFSKRAKLYKERGLKDELLTEDDWKKISILADKKRLWYRVGAEMAEKIDKDLGRKKLTRLIPEPAENFINTYLMLKDR